MTPNDRAPKLGSKKARKPKPLAPNDGPIYYGGLEVRGDFKDFAFITLRSGEDGYFEAKQCRQLGTWLIKAADYLDSKKVRRER